jgi:hypothetical protein
MKSDVKKRDRKRDGTYYLNGRVKERKEERNKHMEVARESKKGRRI